MRPPSPMSLRQALVTLKRLEHTSKQLDNHLFAQEREAIQDTCSTLAALTGEHATIVGPRALGKFGARNCRDCKHPLDAIDLRDAEECCYLCRDKLAEYKADGDSRDES